MENWVSRARKVLERLAGGGALLVTEYGAVGIYGDQIQAPGHWYFGFCLSSVVFFIYVCYCLFMLFLFRIHVIMIHFAF